MIFFDFLYYLIFKFYSDYKEKGAQSTATAIVGGFQTINVVTIMFLYSLLFQQKTYFNKLIGVLLFLIFQVYTYVRYIYKDENSPEVIEQKWLNKTERYRRQVGIWLFVYGAISIILVFSLAIYLGNRNREAY